MNTSLDQRGEPARSTRIDDVIALVAELRAGHEVPTGSSVLWTDAFGLLLLVSLYRWTGEADYLVQARSLVEAVEAVLCPGEARRLDLAAWILSLGRLAQIEPEYRSHAVELVRRAHPRFVGPDSGERTGRASHLDGSSGRNRTEAVEEYFAYVAYRALDEPRLSMEIADLRRQIEASYRDLVVTQDLALGTMLWATHFHPEEPWAELQRGRCLRILEHLWVETPGYFCREPGLTRDKSAVANHVISIALQSVGAMPERVERLKRSLRPPRSLGDRGRQDALIVLACCADLPSEILHARSIA